MVAEGSDFRPAGRSAGVHVTSMAIGPIGSPLGGSQYASATKNPRSGWKSITMPWKTPPSRPEHRSSTSSASGHSSAYAPSGRGVATAVATSHQAASATGSKNAARTRPGVDSIRIECSKPTLAVMSTCRTLAP